MFGTLHPSWVPSKVKDLCAVLADCAAEGATPGRPMPPHVNDTSLVEDMLAVERLATPMGQSERLKADRAISLRHRKQIASKQSPEPLLNLMISIHNGK